MKPELIPLDEALTDAPKADPLLVKLQRRFGMEQTFPLAEAAALLDLSLADTLILFRNDLSDAYVRVAQNGNQWWIVKACPTKSAAESLWLQFRVLFHGKLYLTAAQIAWMTRQPLPAINWALSMLVRHRYLQVVMGGGNGVTQTLYEPMQKRRVIFRGERRRRVLYHGY